jgi:hypothetical protein
MRRRAAFPVSLLLAALAAGPACAVSPSAGSASDPLGLDAGEANDEAAFQAWAKDPRGAARHPAAKFEWFVHSDRRYRVDYFSFVTKQAGLKGPAAQALKALAETVLARAPMMTSPPGTRDLQAKDKRLAAKLAAQGKDFFRLMPRAARVRVYQIAEKFELARLATLNIVRMGQSEITDVWVDQERAVEAHNEEGYLVGMLKGREPATERAILEDFKLTVTFMLTYAGPPPYVHGDAARNKVRAEKRKARAALLKNLEPITF